MLSTRRLRLPFAVFVGLRYTRAKRRNHFISFISLTSMLGIALGVAALIIVLSVMNGFQNELRTRILGITSHLEISTPNGKLPEWETLSTRLSNTPGMVGKAPYISEQGMLNARGQVQGVLIRGVLPASELQVADLTTAMKLGRLDDLRAGEFGIVLGLDLAQMLGVGMGDKVVLLAPQIQVSPAGVMPRLKQFTVRGLFQIGMYEYDSGLALIHLNDAALLYRMGESVSGLRLKLKDSFAAPSLARHLDAVLNQSSDKYVIRDWSAQHANFFHAVQLEKRVMFIILTLIVAVAAFNIVSTLVMAVTDKRADIAILRTLGATPATISQIFMVQGTLIGLIGTGIGILLGVVLALNIDSVVPWIEHALGMQFLAKDVYYISELPSKLEWSDVCGIALMSLTLCFIATIYPSLRAAQLNPAEALRYE